MWLEGKNLQKLVYMNIIDYFQQDINSKERNYIDYFAGRNKSEYGVLKFYA